MKKGLTLLEVLISLVLLTIFILGGMSLYAGSVSQSGRSKFQLTEAWLAKGKLDTLAENPRPLEKKDGKFPAPFQGYHYHVSQDQSPEDPSVRILTVEVNGPDQTKVVLERLTSYSPTHNP